ncbi:MAG: hypothetical protein K0Q73_4102, partial [Paenibacillus sp.]|nr:hypothetical protein [Paenibacillus sp.]
ERGGGKVEITVEESNPVFNAIFPNILLLYSELNKKYGKATGFDV